MRKSALFTIVSAVCLFVSCSSKSEKPQVDSEQNKIQVTESKFSNVDTTAVFDLTKTFVDMLKDKKYDSALSMLYYQDGEKLLPLTIDQKKRQLIALTSMQGIDYEIERIVFDSDTENDIKINSIFRKQEPGDTRPNSIGFHLRPIRQDGKWYLTTVDNHSDTRNSAHPHNEAVDTNN